MTYRKSRIRIALAASGLLAMAALASLPVLADALAKPLTFQNLTTADGLSSDMILSVGVQSGKVWFGTYAGGATLYDPATRTFKAYTTKGEPQDKTDGRSIDWKNSLPYNHVSAIQVDGDQVWFGTYFYGFGGGGISAYRAASKSPWRKFTTFNRRAKKVVSLAVEPKGVWVGSERGLSFLDRKTGQWSLFYTTTDGLAGNFVNALVNEPDVLWAGTNAGVSRFDKARKTWKTYALKEGIEDLDVKCLAKVGDGLWAGTSGGKLFAYDPRADRWGAMSVPEGLAKGTVNSLAVSGGRVFVCRDDGVDVRDLASGEWSGLRSADGLPSDTVLSSAPAPDGIWFGTDSGASFLRLTGASPQAQIRKTP